MLKITIHAKNADIYEKQYMYYFKDTSNMRFSENQPQAEALKAANGIKVSDTRHFQYFS